MCPAELLWLQWSNCRSREKVGDGLGLWFLHRKIRPPNFVLSWVGCGQKSSWTSAPPLFCKLTLCPYWQLCTVPLDITKIILNTNLPLSLLVCLSSMFGNIGRNCPFWNTLRYSKLSFVVTFLWTLNHVLTHTLLLPSIRTWISPFHLFIWWSGTVLVSALLIFSELQVQLKRHQMHDKGIGCLHECPVLKT